MADSLGDRCKELEMMENARKAMKGIPLLARLDGKAFHTFCRGLRRPYDERLSNLMIDTTAFLVEEMHALIGYTQSDEISLVWFVEGDSKSEYPFDGRISKLTSVLAGLASSFFSKENVQRIPEKAHFYPVFDCRVWQVPTKQAALDAFIWRSDDASKNSVSMAAHALYSTKELEGKHTEDKHEMLFQKGINWNDYPAFFKRGTFVRRETAERLLTSEELEAIPEKHRPSPDTLVMRSAVQTLEMPPVRKVTNFMDVVFDKAYPLKKEETQDGK